MATELATGDKTCDKTKECEIDDISTTEIVKKLEEYKHDNTEFFYLYVSTAGEEDDDDDEPMETDPPSLPAAPPDVHKKARKKVMKKVHQNVLPRVLAPRGWKKVCDKDWTPTYRALYFNIIQKHEDEDDDSYIRRVSEIRSILVDEVCKVKKDNNIKVDFKFNTLLSKPFRYY